MSLGKNGGLKGYTVSDCSAVANIYHSHHFTETVEDAAAVAMKAGLDLNVTGIVISVLCIVIFLE